MLYVSLPSIDRLLGTSDYVRYMLNSRSFKSLLIERGLTCENVHCMVSDVKGHKNKLTFIKLQVARLLLSWYYTQSLKDSVYELLDEEQRLDVSLIINSKIKRKGKDAYIQLAPKAKRERVVQEIYATKLNAEMEVITKHGRADLVSSTHVWEVKELKGWKSALGQAQVYAKDLNLKPGIILYDTRANRASINTTSIEDILDDFGVDVIFTWKRLKKLSSDGRTPLVS